MANIMKPRNAPASAAGAAAALQKDGAEAQHPATQSAAPALFNVPGGFKLKKRITLPTLSMKTEGDMAVLKTMTNPEVSSVTDTAGQKENAVVCDVIDMETGQNMRWLLPSVVLGNFIKEYAKSPEAAAAAAALMETRKPVTGADGKKVEKTPDEKNAIMRKALEASGCNIIGKIFAVQNMGKRKDGQRYADFNLAELEEEPKAAEPAK